MNPIGPGCCSMWHRVDHYDDEDGTLLGIHLMPSVAREHTFREPCWCNPEFDDDLIVHRLIH